MSQMSQSRGGKIFQVGSSDNEGDDSSSTSAASEGGEAPESISRPEVQPQVASSWKFISPWYYADQVYSKISGNTANVSKPQASLLESTAAAGGGFNSRRETDQVPDPTPPATPSNQRDKPGKNGGSHIILTKELTDWLDHLAQIDGLTTARESSTVSEALRVASLPAAWTLKKTSSVFHSLASPITAIGGYVHRYVSTDAQLRQQKIEELRLQLDKAVSYEEWVETASHLDELEGNDKWKMDPKSADYDYDMIEKRLDQLRRARETNDIDSMIFLLRTSLSRNLGYMGNPRLYGKTRVGTKHLIDEYIDEVIMQLNMIADHTSSVYSLDAKIEFFVNTRQFFGRTALLLSGGATLGLNHVGVIKALHECKLLPRIISGSSAGSLVAAFVCSKTDEELITLVRENKLSLNALEAPDEEGNFFYKVSRFIKHGVIFDVKVMQDCVRGNIGDITFQEAYNRTRRILNITVSSSTQFEMPRLLNYLTAPNVLIWSAVAASCAIPFIYKSAPLMARDKQGNIAPWNPSGHRWIDGSVENDLPMLRLSEMFNVNHFIVCQVNPHVAPFLPKHDVSNFGYQLVSKSFSLLKSEIQHRMRQLVELGVFPTTLHRMQNILAQKYDGDITIIPDVRLKDYRQLMSNPSRDSLLDAITRGERATWPRISIIRNHCQIELKLDEILYRLRCRKLDLTLPPQSLDLSARPLSLTPGIMSHSLFSRDLTQSMIALESDPAEWNPEAGLGRSKSYVRPRNRERSLDVEVTSMSVSTSPKRAQSVHRVAPNDDTKSEPSPETTSSSKATPNAVQGNLKFITTALKMTPIGNADKSSSQ